MTRNEKIIEEGRIIRQFLKHFKNNKYDEFDEEFNEILEEGIKRIFQLEMNEMGIKYDPNETASKNDIKLKLIDDSRKTIRGRQKNGAEIKYKGKTIVKIKPRIVYNKSKLYKGLDNDDQKIRMLSCKKMFKTVFHEIQHQIQHKMVEQCVSNKETIMYARDFALRVWLGNDFYKKQNYSNYSIEANANKVGYEKYLEAVGKNDQYIEYLKDIEEGRFSLGKYEAHKESTFFDEGYNIDLDERDDVSVKILDDLICVKGQTDILKLYPVLLKEYNKDGSKKTVVQLINNMIKEKREFLNNNDLSEDEKAELINDSKEMYYELIYRQLQRYDRNHAAKLIDKLKATNNYGLFSDMIDYFEKEKNEKLEAKRKMAIAKKELKITRDSDERYSTEGNLQEYYERKKSFISDFISLEEEKTELKFIKVEDIKEATVRGNVTVSRVNKAIKDIKQVKTNQKSESKVNFIRAD